MCKAIISKIFISVFIIAYLGSCSPTHVYVVRHGEKEAVPKDDPPLSVEGAARAERLKDLLEDKKIKKIYSTQTTRTVYTVKPLATTLNKDVLIYDAKNPSELVNKLNKKPTNTLIVGHSNTVRFIINGLAQEEVILKDLDDMEYDNLFEITKHKKGKPTFKVSKF